MIQNSGMNRALWRSTIFVAIRDLFGESLMTICLILSITAVLSPILILQSVKTGVIDRLRSDLIQDPTFREIRPVAADLRKIDLINRIKSWNGVSFAVPSVMLVPREVDFSAEPSASQHMSSAKLVPSSSNDPLLAGSLSAPLQDDTTVVSSDIAARQHLKVNDLLRLSIRRIEADRRRDVNLMLRVVGIAQPDRTSQPTLFCPSKIDREVEDFRAGIAVPDRKWPGIVVAPKQLFDHIVVTTKEELGQTAVDNLRIRTSSSDIEPADEAELSSLYAASIKLQSKGAFYYKLSRLGNDYSLSDIAEAKDVLSNQVSLVSGQNAGLDADLQGRGRLRVVGIDPQFLPDTIRPSWSDQAGALLGLNNSIYLPEALRKDAAGAEQKSVSLVFHLPANSATRSVPVPAQFAGYWPGRDILVSPALLAMVKRGVRSPLVYDSSSESLVETSSGFRGFRVVAQDIQDIPYLVDRFEQEGIHVRAHLEEVLKLQQLDRSLSILVFVVGGVAAVGGVSILTSSFFANVQRKQIAYATLRLIGASRRLVFIIPLFQAFVIATLAILIALVGYLAVSALLNSIVAGAVGFRGKLSTLHPLDLLIIVFAVQCGSLGASLLAARAATKIDPSAAIRAS